MLIWDFIATEFWLSAHQFFPLQISIATRNWLYVASTIFALFEENRVGIQTTPHCNGKWDVRDKCVCVCECVSVVYHTHSLKWKTDMRSVVSAVRVPLKTMEHTLLLFRTFISRNTFIASHTQRDGFGIFIRMFDVQCSMFIPMKRIDRCNISYLLLALPSPAHIFLFLYLSFDSVLC